MRRTMFLFSLQVENPDVQNQNSPNIFGTSDFDGADLLKDLKNNVQVRLMSTMKILV